MRRLTVLLITVSLLVGIAPATASAQSTDIVCPASVVPDAGFVDVDRSSFHFNDINCLAWFGISTGTTPTTFDPDGQVTRWQMALFLMRTFDWVFPNAVSGVGQGFTDIASLTPETQIAINQLKQLSITSGTSPTTFSPGETLARWEMALFLTRLLTASGVTLPSGLGQGFADIGSLPTGTQTAINQLKQLGITSGTTATTFSPHGVVSRDQMASFVMRTLQAVGSLDVLILVSNVNFDDPENVVLEAFYPANRDFVIRSGWRWSPLPVPPDSPFLTSDFRMDIVWNGRTLAPVEKLITLDDVMFKYHEASFPGGLTGTQSFVLEFYADGQVQSTLTMNVVFG
jgi:hypothetical protein